jgi:predicted RNase H-like HicB family nuclease
MKNYATLHLKKEGKYWVVYSEELDLSSYAKTREKAMKRFKEVFWIHFEHKLNKAFEEWKK